MRLSECSVATHVTKHRQHSIIVARINLMLLLAIFIHNAEVKRQCTTAGDLLAPAF